MRSTHSVPRGEAYGPGEESRQPQWRSRGGQVVRRMFIALWVPAYRYLWFGMIAAFAGMQMSMVARGYLAYDLTGSATVLGLVSMAMGIPMLVLSPLGGVLADRMDRRQILIGSQVVMALTSFALALLIHAGVIQVWHLILLGLLQGGVFTVHMPARSSVVPALVGKERLGNAIALNNSGRNLMGVAAPGIAGMIIATPWLGTAGAFAVIAVMYLVAVWFTVRLPEDLEAQRTHNGDSMRVQFIQGFRYVLESRTLRVLMSIAFFPTLLGMSYQFLLPVVQAEVLQVGPRELGLLYSAAGVGGVVGSLLVGYFSGSRRIHTIQLLFGFLLGLALLGFALSRWFGASLVLAGLIGLAVNAYMAVNSTLVMLSTDEAYYGRVMSIYMMMWSFMPLIALPMGALADLLGVTVVLGGSACLIMLFLAGAHLATAHWRRTAGQPGAATQTSSAGPT
jgi:MFS family permease